MSLRRVDITRTANVANPERLASHPRVRKAWVMPWHFTLFEFYDPIYEQLDDSASKLSRPTEWTKETRRYMSDLVDAERGILAPLYEGRRRHWQGNKLGLFLKSAIYRIVDYKRLDLPWLGHPTNWEAARTIRVCGRLRSESSTGSLREALYMWSKWLLSVDSAPHMGAIRLKQRDFQVLCEFPSPCGDACMALYTKFIGMSKDNGVEAAGFFPPEETQALYLRIGAPGEITAEIDP
jgi:hypothetical protein